MMTGFADIKWHMTSGEPPPSFRMLWLSIQIYQDIKIGSTEGGCLIRKISAGVFLGKKWILRREERKVRIEAWAFMDNHISNEFTCTEYTDLGVYSLYGSKYFLPM